MRAQELVAKRYKAEVATIVSILILKQPCVYKGEVPGTCTLKYEQGTLARDLLTKSSSTKVFQW